MPRYALKIEYHGAPFVGWQRQKEHVSVQGCIENALRKLQPDFDSIAAAGRTDAGVHATAQVAHCDMTREWTPFRLSEALNHLLRPDPIAIVDVAAVPDSFHARFSALERRYLFRVVYRRALVTIDKGLVWQVRKPLDVGAMQQAAGYLLGKHDFSTFRSVMCQALTPIKTMDQLDIEAVDYPGGVEYRFKVRARSFLHNQVRSIVGSLEHVGTGSWSPQDFRTALDAADRRACGTVAPPFGLYLDGVEYADDPFSREQI